MYARLEEPYGYWNAIGLTAAMGAICCMWLGARRAGHALLNALAYPAMGIVLVTLMLAYSRGALVALAIGLGAVVLHRAAAPARRGGADRRRARRRRGRRLGLLAARPHHRQHPAGERATAGHQLGVLLLAMVLRAHARGDRDRVPQRAGAAPSRATRTRAGATLLALIVLALVAFAGALAHSHRGFTGSISHAVDALTNPNAKPPPNTPGRLTAVASVRARYWKQALQVFDAHPALGAGRRRL